MSSITASQKPVFALSTTTIAPPLGRPTLGIFEESGGHLHRDVVEPAHAGALDVDVPVVLGDLDVHDRRHLDLSLGDPCEGVLDRAQ